MVLWQTYTLEVGCLPTWPAATSGAKPTAKALAHVGTFLGPFIKANSSEHHEATETEKENGGEPVFDCSGINLTAVGMWASG